MIESSPVRAPWNISILGDNDNGTDSLPTSLAPPWVSTPNIRGTMDILQSCVLTLVACIYTALHLDVPTRTSWQHILLEKLKWVTITLFAPEVSVYIAANQLRQAWKLKAELFAIKKRKQASNWTADADFDINLKYAFFLIMGAVRIDVHDILSFDDLDESAREHFEGLNSRRYSVRPGPKLVTWLAERDHWIPVSKKDIDDKSKADVAQKTLVVIQVLWMVMQCIARKVYDMPLTLLEIHTMVHVVCAMFLYLCWFNIVPHF